MVNYILHSIDIINIQPQNLQEFLAPSIENTHIIRCQDNMNAMLEGVTVTGRDGKAWPKCDLKDL